jgi:hypothetical protein
VSQKKSYMDRNNLLSEGFLDKVNKFFKMLKQVNKERKLLKNPSIARQFKSLQKQMQDFDNETRRIAKERGIKLKRI